MDGAGASCCKSPRATGLKRGRIGLHGGRRLAARARLPPQRLRQWNVTSNRMSVIRFDDAGNEAGVAAGLPHAENTES